MKKKTQDKTSIFAFGICVCLRCNPFIGACLIVSFTWPLPPVPYHTRWGGEGGGVRVHHTLTNCSGNLKSDHLKFANISS